MHVNIKSDDNSKKKQKQMQHERKSLFQSVHDKIYFGGSVIEANKQTNKQ